MKIRMSVSLFCALVLIIVIGAIAPHQLPVTAYKLSLISLAAVAGYYIDRECFPYARPDRLLALHIQEPAAGWAAIYAAAQIRRALVVAAVVIAVALGA